jgi:hypothetical protein
VVSAWSAPSRISRKPARCVASTSPSHEHSVAPADSRRRLQSRPTHATADRSWHAARPARSAGCRLGHPSGAHVRSVAWSRGGVMRALHVSPSEPLAIASVMLTPGRHHRNGFHHRTLPPLTFSQAFDLSPSL